MKVVIVGGGTAGWLAASIFAVSDVQRNKNGLPQKLDISVIESENIPIIGAGEGSTGIFSSWLSKKLKLLDIDEMDFLRKTEAILKLKGNKWRLSKEDEETILRITNKLI